MEEAIRQQLHKMEASDGVKILFACETGSRAFGLANETSDFDIRFIYIRPIEFYLSIAPKSDVISLPVTNMFDLQGWDLQKALFLLKKSNPTLLEWLHSPIVYYENSNIIQAMKGTIPEMFSVKACFYHYLNMAKRNFQEVLKGEKSTLKLYINVIRPLLHCLWLEKHKSFPNIDFWVLIKNSDPFIKNEIEKVGNLKKGIHAIPNFSLLDAYIEKELNRLTIIAHHLHEHKGNDTNKLDEIFMLALKQIWEIHF